MAVLLLLSQMAVWMQFGTFSLPLFALSLLASGGVLGICLQYFRKRSRIMEQAAAQIRSFLDGNTDARIDCDEEGELYHLFHCVNTLAAVLNAHAANENREKEFLKNTISDISHQLKTPLAISRSIHRTAVVRITLTEPPVGKRKQYDTNGDEMKYGRMN